MATPVVDERQQRLILDLARDKITAAEFGRAFPAAPHELGGLGLRMLQDALRQEDPVGVEFGLYLGYCFGFSDSYVDVLSRLAEEGWHQRHEDVVGALEKLRLPGTVDVLRRTALVRHGYLEYDESRALGVKCLWALGKIGTPEAVAALGELLCAGDPVLASEAEKQLLRLERRDPPDAVRAAIRQALARKPRPAPEG
ncbi:hypothetical protein [Sorangium sp. So ce131]|uniref:hypothetical protein n=1 Tax=Sorangium sp. So ce131 TaxID=3133282 RepID=UPI003F6337A4